MGRCNLPAVLQAAALFLSSIREISAASWTAQSLPDPQKEPHQCGRQTAGWVCSPDGLLATEQMDVIQGNIVAIRKGEDPYTGLSCDKQQVWVPIELLVVVVESTSGRGDAPERIEAFARGVHDRFGVGTCGSGVVLALATTDRQVRLQRAMLRLCCSCRLLTLCTLRSIAADICTSSNMQPTEHPSLLVIRATEAQ